MTAYASVFLDFFSESENDHKAFHKILNKYIPEGPSSKRRTTLLQELLGYTEEQKESIMSEHYKNLTKNLLAVMLLYSTIKTDFMEQVSTNSIKSRYFSISHQRSYKGLFKMRYRYTFSVNLFDQEKILDFKEGLDKINSDYVLKDHGLYGYRFLTGKIWDFETYNKLICLSEKLNVKTSSVALTERYVKYVDLEYDPQDRLCADYLEIGTKTEYDSEEYLNEFKNGDLFLEKKSLGNFKNFQLNFLDTEDCLVLLAKKRFCSFIEENNIFNINFKPVMVKSVTGSITPSKTIFWAIPEQVFKEGREIFRDSSFDKYHHPIPKSISPKFRDRIEKIDLFFVNEYSCIISQNLYHLIQEAELDDDISGAVPWDVGYFGGEASSKLKQKLIEQGCFDEAFEE